jgi:beta-ribofuranosylaminobenzene 5'-phosphate synthase
MTRVTAPSRLHFGLFHVPAVNTAAAERRFGGIGLMIDLPGTVVSVRPADVWRFEGPLASRAQIFAHRLIGTLGLPFPPLQVLVERCPEEHMGLGVGTQLGLAVAKAIAVQSGLTDLDATDLAVLIDRGERSAVGVHGFDRGGLIVEPGKRETEPLSPLLTCIRLPENWRVAVFVPNSGVVWHGSREEGAFANAKPSGLTESLCDLALRELLPAAAAGDLPLFGASVYEFNRRAGQPFAAAQGGVYSSPEVAATIARIRESGVSCVGQSSWGPAVFAVVEDADRAGALLKQMSGTRAWVAKVSEGHAVEKE